MGVVARAGRWGWLNALSERDFTKCLVKMSGMSALPPPLPITMRRKTPFLCLRRPSLPAGGQGVQRGPARPDACTTDIIPHSCTGVRPGLEGGAVQNGDELLATSGPLKWNLPHGLRARRPCSQGRFPKSGVYPFPRLGVS